MQNPAAMHEAINPAWYSIPGRLLLLFTASPELHRIPEIQYSD
jgi:hypothetical protein